MTPGVASAIARDGHGMSNRTLGSGGLRAWRIMTAAGFLVAFTATHWPKLVFGPEAPSDKVLHAVTFGVLTFLLARAELLTHRALLLLAMVAFSVFDEATQSLPFIHRHTSVADWISDCIGIGVVLGVIAMQSRATTPIGKLRAALASAAQRAVLDRPFNWMALATSALLGVIVGFPLAIAFEHTMFLETRPWQTGFLGSVFFAIVALEIANRSACRAATARIAAQRICLCCGACATTAATCADDSGTCSVCATPWQRAQWVVLCDLFGRSRLQHAVMSLRSGAYGALYVLLALLALGSVIALAAQFIVPRGLSLSALAEIREMRDVIVYALGILATAMIMSVMNTAHMRAREREGIRCLSCDFDLRATSVCAGVGRCPECACEFARLNSSAPLAVAAAVAAAIDAAVDEAHHSLGGANPSGPVDGASPPPS